MKKIRLGTRKSPLALWQAYKVEAQLKAANYDVEIIPISSEGDLKLKQPIYELGITGVFTKTLDIALINNEIDIAVHSLKDVPTQLANGLHLAACLSRGDNRDLLVYKEKNIFSKEQRTIATGSLRRKAFWLHNYPQDTVVDLRGNVQLRLQKLMDNDWDGAIFAYAGLERSEILQDLEKQGLHYQVVQNMVSAPSQGIIGVVARQDLDLSVINDKEAYLAGSIERAFLRKLEGGCTAPIGGFAEIHTHKINFKGAILSLDGKEKVEINTTTNIDKEGRLLGEQFAQNCIEQGADTLVEQIKKEMNQG